MIDSIYWLNGLLYLAMGFAAAWCVFSGIPKFLAFVWKGTKQVLQILAVHAVVLRLLARVVVRVGRRLLLEIGILVLHCGGLRRSMGRGEPCVPPSRSYCASFRNRHHGRPRTTPHVT